jgi:hypothetical protein
LDGLRRAGEAMSGSKLLRIAGADYCHTIGRPFGVLELERDLDPFVKLRDQMNSDSMGLVLFAAFILFIIGVAMIRQLFDLAFLPGTVGSNNFGPDPLESVFALSKKTLALSVVAGVALILYTLGGIYYFFKTGRCLPLFTCNVYINK